MPGSKDKPKKRAGIAEVVTINFSTATIFKVLVIAAALIFLWIIKEIVVMFFVAILIAALIEPAADWLHKRKIPRGLAVLGIYVILLAVIASVLIFLIPTFLAQFQNVLGDLSMIAVGVTESMNQIVAIGEPLGISAEISTYFDSIKASVPSALQLAFSRVADFVVGVISLVIILVLAFYIVVEEDGWRRFFRRVAPDDYQPYLTQMFNKMQTKLGQWLRGQLLLMFIVGLSFYIGLSILGVKSALVLGVFAGLMEVVPYFGPTIAIIPAFFIALVDSPVKAGMVAILFIVIQQVENNILTPKIMQKVTGLNPVVSILALLIGYQLFGIAGALLAIPVATTISVLVYDVFKNPGDK